MIHHCMCACLGCGGKGGSVPLIRVIQEITKLSEPSGTAPMVAISLRNPGMSIVSLVM